jgi:anti-sigma factor RsiW
MAMDTVEAPSSYQFQQELGACSLIQDLLPLYLEGEVSPSSRDLIIEHLPHCERCAGFLAGAQSVRALLRHDARQHAQVIAHDQPAQQALGSGQQAVTGIAVLLAAGLEIGGSVLFWYGVIERSDSVASTVGLVAGVVGLALLIYLARSRNPLTFLRVVALLGCSAAGVLGTGLTFASNGQPLLGMLGVVLWGLLLGGVWLTVWQRPASVPGGH